MKLPASMVVAALVVLLAPGARAAVTARAQIDPPRVAVGDQADLTVDVRGTQNARRAGDPRGRRPDHPVCRAVDAALDRERPDQLVDHAPLQRDPAPRGDLHDRPDHRQRRRADDPGGDGRLAGRSVGCRGRHRRTSSCISTWPRRAPRVYLHERLPITVTLRSASVQVGDVQYPQVPGDGFALEPLGKPQQRQEVRDGAVFQVVEFQTR